LLDLTVSELQDGLLLHVDYAANRYKAESMDRFIRYVSEFIRRIVQEKWISVKLEK